MPYCSSCGNQVHDRDIFCGKCGVRQPVAGQTQYRQAQAPPPPPMVDPLGTVSPRTASILCYIPVMGWIAAVVVLASQRFRKDMTVRFHAFQGLYLFAAWLVADWAIQPTFEAIGGPLNHIARLLEALIFAASIFMVVKTSQSQTFSLPILGELAHKSAMES